MREQRPTSEAPAGLAGAFEDSRDGAVVRVRARPRAPRDAVDGVHAGALRVSVRAAPERGKANDAVLRTLARWLGIPPSALVVLTGETAREKRVRAAGYTASDLRKRAFARFASGGERIS